MDDASTKVVLIVDDEPANIVLIKDMIAHYVDRWTIETRTASDGVAALKLLASEPQGIDAVLLDQRMPRMSGIEVLAQMRSTPSLASIPVILQTAVRGAEFENEAAREGAFHYLQKPYVGPLLGSVLEEALDTTLRRLTGNPAEPPPAQHSFRVSNLDDARLVATEIASFCPQPERALLGLLELLVNAVEHGNLGISYDEKTRLCEAGSWEQEVKRRLALPEHAEKVVDVRFERHSGEYHVWIRDAGQGFGWNQYLSIGPERSPDRERGARRDLHGRGIALASIVSFDWLEYLGNGNEVHAMIRDAGPPATDPPTLEIAV